MDQEKTGKFIARMRREKEMTQAQLGERLGVTNKTVSRWETGKSLPDIAILIELAEFYNVDINEILDGKRKDNTNVEPKELINAIANYTNHDMEIILNRIKRYSFISICALFLGIIFAIFDFSNKFYQITDLLFGLTAISIIEVLLSSNGKIEEIKKQNFSIKILFFLLVFLTVAVVLILILTGIIS